jgi:hypothetical protein
MIATREPRNLPTYRLESLDGDPRAALTAPLRF